MCNRIDKLGRLVIPINLRKKYNLCEGAAVEFRERTAVWLFKTLLRYAEYVGKTPVRTRFFPCAKSVLIR